MMDRTDPFALMYQEWKRQMIELFRVCPDDATAQEIIATADGQTLREIASALWGVEQAQRWRRRKGDDQPLR